MATTCLIAGILVTLSAAILPRVSVSTAPCAKFPNPPRMEPKATNLHPILAFVPRNKKPIRAPMINNGMSTGASAMVHQLEDLSMILGSSRAKKNANPPPPIDELPIGSPRGHSGALL